MSVLCAATGDGVALLAEGNGAWRVRVALAEAGIRSVARDPSDPKRLLAGSAGQGVWQSSDGGETWQRLDFPETDVFSVAVGAADGALYAGCEPSMLFRSDDGGSSWRELAALREIPSAPTWSFPPRPWTSHVRWVAPSPHDASLLLAGIELGGLMRSEDGGETWSDHRPGAQRDVHALAWHPRVRHRAYEAAGGGAALSVDGGETWEPADDGRDRHYTWALAVDPEDPDVWYVSASTGPYAAHGRASAQAHIYRRRGGEPWELLTGGLPEPLDAMPYALAFAGGHLVAGFADGTVSTSTDGGDRWVNVRLEGDRLEHVVAFA